VGAGADVCTGAAAVRGGSSLTEVWGAEAGALAQAVAKSAQVTWANLFLRLKPTLMLGPPLGQCERTPLPVLFDQEHPIRLNSRNARAVLQEVANPNDLVADDRDRLVVGDEDRREPTTARRSCANSRAIPGRRNGISLLEGGGRPLEWFNGDMDVVSGEGCGLHGGRHVGGYVPEVGAAARASRRTSRSRGKAVSRQGGEGCQRQRRRVQEMTRNGVVHSQM
jgi:hypothetical protein